MRKLHLFLSIFALILFCSNGLDAQIIKPGFTLGFGAAYAHPLDEFKRGYKFGLGGDLYGGVGWGKTYIMATVGYRGFVEDVSTNAKTMGYIPVKLGLRQYILLKRLYLQANAGVASLRQSGSTTNAFTYDVGAGLKFAGFEIAAFYDAFKPENATGYSNSINGRIGYNFSL